MEAAQAREKRDLRMQALVATLGQGGGKELARLLG